MGTSPLRLAMAATNAGCSAVVPARPGSPSARGRPSSAPACPATAPWRSCTTWPRAAASARPAAWSVSRRTPSSATPCGPATRPANSTTSWWLFPPQTREVQFDEKWSFVTKKEKHTDPDDPAAPEQGDQWDHVAFDPEHRLVVSVVVGKRTEEHT